MENDLETEEKEEVEENEKNNTYIVQKDKKHRITSCTARRRNFNHKKSLVKRRSR